MQGSKIPDDPFKHDLVRLIDLQQEYFRIDLLLALYKWEVEGLPLAKRTQRDKKLARLLNPPPEDEVKEMPEEYLPKNLSPVGSYSGT
jgi:hypothetical protein